MQMVQYNGMSIPEFDTDDSSDVKALQSMRPDPAVREVFERQTRYASPQSREVGLTPLHEDTSVRLIPDDELKEAIEYAHQMQSTPRFHQQATWAPENTRWNQGSLGYCWTWAGCAAFMDCRAAEYKPTVQVAPVTMGWLVNWQNRGNYLESFIRGLREEGVSPASCVPDDAWHTPNPRRFDDCWETERANLRLDKVWDTDRNNMLQHAVTIACNGRPGYNAYNWWGHALDVVDWIWDPQEGWKCVLRNSHNKAQLLILKGSRAIPDELYGFASTVNVAA